MRNGGNELELLNETRKTVDSISQMDIELYGEELLSLLLHRELEGEEEKAVQKRVIVTVLTKHPASVRYILQL